LKVHPPSAAEQDKAIDFARNVLLLNFLAILFPFI
jgi:hypothetical protein